MKSAGQLGLPCTVTGTIKFYNPLEELLQLLRNMNLFHSKAMKSYAYRRSGVRILTLALFIIVTHCSAGERINKL